MAAAAAEAQPSVWCRELQLLHDALRWLVSPSRCKNQQKERFIYDVVPLHVSRDSVKVNRLLQFKQHDSCYSIGSKEDEHRSETF